MSESKASRTAFTPALAYSVLTPVYDIALVGYPQRMRDYNERKKKDNA